jgi:NarL family two-component system response regulator LiaR
MEKRVSVLVVDDDPRYAFALRALLETEPWLEVIGEARNGRQAVETARELRPDVILMDVDMPVLDGVGATRQILAERPEVCIVLVTGSDVHAHLNGAQQAGAAGYVAKSAAFTELVDVIRDRCP